MWPKFDPRNRQWLMGYGGRPLGHVGLLYILRLPPTSLTPLRSRRLIFVSKPCQTRAVFTTIRQVLVRGDKFSRRWRSREPREIFSLANNSLFTGNWKTCISIVVKLKKVQFSSVQLYSYKDLDHFKSTECHRFILRFLFFVTSMLDLSFLGPLLDIARVNMQ